MRKRFLSVSMIAMALFVFAEGKADKVFVAPKGQAQVFLDDELIASKENISRVWHKLRKHPNNPLIQKSGLEHCTFLFGTVLREPDPVRGGEPIFRMWYFAAGNYVDGKGMTWVAYATSRDGIRWQKPKLGLYDIGGSKENNAVWMPDGWQLGGLSGVVKDPNPDVPKSERYKMVIMAAGHENDKRIKRYLMAVSDDGIHWKRHGFYNPPTLSQVPPGKPDRACFVWDPYRKVYALYYRGKYAPDELKQRGGPAYWGRAVNLAISKDFKRWGQEVMVMHAESDDPDGTELYGTATFPYAGQWVSLVQIHRVLPHLAYIDVGIAHSRDGINWQREKELILPRGGVGKWDRFNQCASTRSVQVGDELWIYYSGRPYRHGEYKRTGLKDTGPWEARIGLATIRLDGWCSLQASFDGGQIVTKPVVLPRGELFVNAKSGWGEILVEVIDSKGNVVEGMKSEPVIGDGVCFPVRWPQGRSLDRIAGKQVQLRFTLKNALLYSWKVE